MSEGQWRGGFEPSKNVEDRRPGSKNPQSKQKMKMAAIGGVSALMAAFAGWFGAAALVSNPNPVVPIDKATSFIESVLGDMEAQWKPLLGNQYRAPKMIIYTRSTSTKGCDFAKSAYGPFYCPDDEKIYLDLSFFVELDTQACKKKGDPCEFARAYVIAHEWGHHVQKVLGTMDWVINNRIPEEGKQGASVRMELQADCYAGIWAGNSNLKWKNISQELLLAGQQAAEWGGDGPTGPPSHGTAAQRSSWFMKGFQGKRITACDTFSTDQL